MPPKRSASSRTLLHSSAATFTERNASRGTVRPSPASASMSAAHLRPSPVRAIRPRAPCAPPAPVIFAEPCREPSAMGSAFRRDDVLEVGSRPAPPSRARGRADCFMPPKRRADANRAVRLTDMTPPRPAGNTERARRARQIEPSVRGVVRDRIASACPRTNHAATGPNTSSRAPVVVPPRRACTEPEAAVGASPRNGLPSTKEPTAARCPAEISGPISVASSVGSPTLTPRVASTRSSRSGRRPSLNSDP